MNNNEKLPNEMINYGQNFEKDLEKLSPFEIKNNLINYAKESCKNSSSMFLNAGRGNPNWIATIPRQALFLIGQFGIHDCIKNSNYEQKDIAPIPEKKGIADRFMHYLGDCMVSKFLRKAYAYCVTKGIAGDDLVYEWVSGVIGDQYPNPDRILINTEIILNWYLKQEMCANSKESTKYDLFATEGGTAAMCNLFYTL